MIAQIRPDYVNCTASGPIFNYANKTTTTKPNPAKDGQGMTRTNKTNSGVQEMRQTLLAIFTLFATVGIASVAYGDDDDESGGKALRFEANLSGAQEVPGVATDTTGRFRINFNRDLSEANFRLSVNDGTGITQAHLHCGRAGTNGPIIVFLFALIPSGIDVDGKLSEGTLTNADFIFSTLTCAPLTGRPVNNIASLALMARDGLVYVNVHSLANQGGEVRGQLLER